jgi:hypothetical protein
MSDCTVNIADFRSFHVMKALRTDAPRPQPTAKDGDFTLPIHLCQLDFGSRDARVLDISMIREAWLNGHRARNKAKVLRFVEPVSRFNSVRFNEAEGDLDDSDPSDCPPAA